MANPRRNNPYPIPNNQEIPIYNNNPQFQPQTRTLTSRLELFLKKPQSFPFLLSIFLILTWVFLRIQQTHSQIKNIPKSFTPTKDLDHEANLIRFKSNFPSQITKDTRGWMLDPVSVAKESGVRGGAVSCVSVHVGEIKPGGVRGNHRHYDCNETVLIWGGRTVFRLENGGMGKGYGEVVVEADEVAVAGSPVGTAHALVNVDLVLSSFIIGCQDCVVGYNKTSSDFGVWDDLKV